MSTERPTFHESWYRVGPLRPRLRSGVRVQRQHYRGRPWWVVRDPATNRFFRMNESAWRFVGLLDGNRTIDEAWALSNRASADDAPTQGEAIGLLGQLHSSDLLAGEVPPDVESLLHRKRERTEREWRGRLEQLLAVRLPLFDPDRLLGAIAPWLAWAFTPVGFLLWVLAIAFGVWQLMGRGAALTEQATSLLAPANLLPLYGATVLAKLFHELGHGVACKVFGRREGTGGEVHALGVMFLVFVPLPYVDATSAWGLRSKSSRVVVGAAGMMAELLLATGAALAWTRAAEGSALSAFAFNLMLVAGVTTLLFNANPLLRYDGYYILSDLLESPNLQQRARDTLHRFVKKRAWGVRRLPAPVATGSERVWLIAYALASGAYKLLVAAIIIAFVSQQLLIVGALLALAAVVVWFVVPVGRFVAYLFNDPELERERPRAIAVTAAALVLLFGVVALVPVPNSLTIAGRAESRTLRPVALGADGFLEWVGAPGARVAYDEPVARAENKEAQAAIEGAFARFTAAQARANAALAEDPALASIARARADAERARVYELAQRMSALSVPAGASGVWLPDADAAIVGRFTPRGTRIGLVVDPRRSEVRCAVGQRDAAELIGRVGRIVRVRPAGRPDLEFAGAVKSVVEAGLEQEAPPGAPRSERVFEVRIEPRGEAEVFSGQHCLVRVPLEPEALGRRWWRAALRAVQRRSEG